VTDYFWQYGTVGALALVGGAVVVGAFALNRLVRPRRPRPEKLTTYECGIDPVGEGWSQTQIRYYIFAFLFVIFDVESVFLFPWAVVFEDLERAGQVLVEMVIFIGILALGLLYAWRKRVLEWL
jgi:NADH-quinone oxidoreductase subunit A